LRNHVLPKRAYSSALRALLILSLYFAVVRPSFAGRPLTVDDAAPVPPRHLELEAGFFYRLPDAGGRDQKWPVISAAYGVIDSLEFGLAIQRTNQDAPREAPIKGFEDLHLTTKYRFLEQRESVPALAFSLDVKLPTANRAKGLSSGKTDQALLLIATQSWTPFMIHANFGYTIVGDSVENPLKNLLRGGLAGEWSLDSRWSLIGEVTGVSRSAKGEPNQADFQLGLRYALQSGFVLDFAGGRSLRSSGTSIQGTFGITWTVDVSALLKR